MYVYESESGMRFKLNHLPKEMREELNFTNTPSLDSDFVEVDRPFPRTELSR